MAVVCGSVRDDRGRTHSIIAVECINNWFGIEDLVNTVSLKVSIIVELDRRM